MSCSWHHQTVCTHSLHRYARRNAYLTIQQYRRRTCNGEYQVQCRVNTTLHRYDCVQLRAERRPLLGTIRHLAEKPSARFRLALANNCSTVVLLEAMQRSDSLFGTTVAQRTRLRCEDSALRSGGLSTCTASRRCTRRHYASASTHRQLTSSMIKERQLFPFLIRWSSVLRRRFAGVPFVSAPVLGFVSCLRS